MGLLVTPLSTRDTVRSARDDLLTSLAQLLEGTADWVEKDPPRPNLDALARAVDDRVRRLTLVARPLTRPLIGSRSPRTRHRLRLYQALSAQSRTLVAALYRSCTAEPGCVAQACRAMAEAADALTEALPGKAAPAMDQPLDRAEAALFQQRDGLEPTHDVLRAVAHLHATLAELADSTRGITERPEAAH